jgi:hypothetical protein
MVVEVADWDPLGKCEKTPVMVHVVVRENHVVNCVDPSEVQYLEDPIEISLPGVPGVDEQ